MPPARDETIHGTTTGSSALGEDGLVTHDGHSLVSHATPNEVSQQLPDAKLKAADYDVKDSPYDGGVRQPKNEDSAGLSRTPDQDKEAGKPGTESSHAIGNSTEEDFLKLMLNYFSGDINTTIDLQSQLVSLVPDHRSDKASQLNNLALSYLTRFGRFGEVTDIEMAIDCLNKAMALTPNGHLGHPICLNNLGSAYRSRYERLGDPEDLEKAAKYQAQGISLAPDTYEDKSSWLNNLGNTYQRRFERQGDLEDINKAISYKTQAVALTPDDHTNKATFLSNLGSSFKSRFEHRGELADIHQAIDHQTQAAALTVDHNEDKPIWLSNLGISYQRRFERLGQAEDIENAIACQLKAVSLTPEDYADRPLWMSNLGILYQHRYKSLARDEDLIQSIDYLSQALSLCPDNHYNRLSMHLNLGNSLYLRFSRFGRVADIDKAIEYLNLAVSSLPKGHSDQPVWLNNLGAFFTSRFELLNEITDIDKATKCLVKALSLIPDYHTQKPAILVNLATSYQLRSESELIDVAIGCITGAISHTPDGHETKPVYIQRLGSSHQTRYNNFKQSKDLDEAIRYQIAAIELVPTTFANKANWLVSLGQSYQDRFNCNGDPQDLNQAISHYSTAISNTPDDHAYNPVISYSLASAYEARFVKYGSQEDLKAAISSYQKASHPTISKSSTTFLAARKWAELFSLHKLPCAHAAYQRAMELIPQLLWLGRTIEQRYNEIRTMGSLASEAAPHAISLRSYDLALEWLEQGRSIVWNQTLQLRTPFDALSTIDEGLAYELRDIGHSLEHAGSRLANLVSSTGEIFDLKRDAQRHRELASEWDRLLTRVREIPGFEEFLRPKSSKGLINASKKGLVVVINVSETQGDALILAHNNSEIAHIPLLGISRSKALSLRLRFYPLLRDHGLLSREARGIKRFGYNPRNMFAKVLAALWTDIVEPILRFLGIKEELPTEELPHITWCTTGDLVGLPLHAAGLHDSSQPGAFDLVVSSYTPTISALLTSFPGSSNFSGILAVGQENTPGFPRLGNTRVELAVIKERSQFASSSNLQLEGEKATVDAVLKGMERCSWVHFACHASQNRDDPINSAFHLHDGNLKLSRITQTSFKNKGLAFLSACETATGAEDLPDEAIHLAAGLLMTGYPSVIATLWSVYDEDAPEISRDVYAYLLTETGLGRTDAARALHSAVRKLRTKVG
ncbi:unnamed protein product, partial [Rhizoctonia solani]